MRRIFSLCFSEITLEASRNDARIFERNFVESSQGQITKFAHFALITFSQYCKYGNLNGCYSKCITFKELRNTFYSKKEIIYIYRCVNDVGLPTMMFREKDPKDTGRFFFTKA